MTDDESNDMRDSASDDPWDGALRRAALDYNAPPATPREAMWERIAAARAARPTPVGVIPLAPRRVTGVRPTRRAPWALPLAAALLLGVGIGVGRLSITRDAGRSGVVATTTSPVPTERSAPAEPGGAARSGVAGGPGAAPRTRSPERGVGGERREGDAPLAYQLATAEHLLSTETLLTTMSADARAGRADTALAAWARDLLGTTRVLLDSPAGRDPTTARLLQDLELVLAQVAQMPGSRGVEEIQSIERAVRRRDVMTRVRAAIPAGPLSAGT